MNFKLFLISAVSLVTATLNAQVKKTAYQSTNYSESVWSRSKDKYSEVEQVELKSQFLFTSEGIYFKKGGNPDWLYNTWTFEKTDKSDPNLTMDIYYDERGQKVVIYYEQSELWYYHDLDPDTRRYNKITMYHNCREDLDLISELEKRKNETEPTSGSTKFRVDMNYVALYNSKTEKWSEWEKGYNTFVINANDNRDIVHIKANGEEVNYRRISQKVERNTTSDGKEYQIIYCLDDNGNKFQFQIFDDIKIGIKLIYGDVLIQFAKF